MKKSPIEQLLKVRMEHLGVESVPFHQDCQTCFLLETSFNGERHRHASGYLRSVLRSIRRSATTYKSVFVIMDGFGEPDKDKYLVDYITEKLVSSK